MTRLLCTGDLHIGAGAAYADDRLADQEALLEQLVDVAREHEVDGLLLAGDIFERPKPTPAELHVFAKFARRLRRWALPCVAILGDVRHDQLSADQPSALELFEHGDWMRVSRHPEQIHVAGVAVCTLPAAPVTRLVAKLGGREDSNAVAVAFLLEAAAELRAQAPSPAVLLAHWAVEGASLPNGLPVSDLHKPVLPLPALENLGFDAVVLGDIHNAAVLNDWPGPRGPVFYVGSPICLNFGEENVPHGCWILDLPAGLLEFVPLPGRRFVTVDVDLTAEPWTSDIRDGLCDETDVVAAAIAQEFSEDSLASAVVRIRYRCTEIQARRVDVAALKGFCREADAHRVYQVVPEIVRATRARVSGVDETLGPREVVQAWADANALDEEQRRSLNAIADHYLEGVAA